MESDLPARSRQDGQVEVAARVDAPRGPRAEGHDEPQPEPRRDLGQPLGLLRRQVHASPRPCYHSNAAAAPGHPVRRPIAQSRSHGKKVRLRIGTRMEPDVHRLHRHGWPSSNGSYPRDPDRASPAGSRAAQARPLPATMPSAAWATMCGPPP